MDPGTHEDVHHRIAVAQAEHVAAITVVQHAQRRLP
jgi:hypothetical protein